MVIHPERFIKRMLGKSRAYRTEDLIMEANYHTHTWRCRHASGTERDYIENAIDSEFVEKKSVGLESPYEFKNDNGLGRVYAYKDEIIHLSYFTQIDDLAQHEDEGAEGLRVTF